MTLTLSGHDSKLRFRIKWKIAAKWIFFRHAVFGNFSTPKTKSGFGINIRHWIDLSAGTEFFSRLKLLTKIWPFKRHFEAYFHFHGFSDGNFRTFFLFLNFWSKFRNPQPTNVHNSLFYSFQKGGGDFWSRSKPSNTRLLRLFSWEIGKIRKCFFSTFLFPMSFRKPIQKFSMYVGELWQLKFWL